MLGKGFFLKTKLQRMLLRYMMSFSISKGYHAIGHGFFIHLIQKMLLSSMTSLSFSFSFSFSFLMLKSLYERVFISCMTPFSMLKNLT